MFSKGLAHLDDFISFVLHKGKGNFPDTKDGLTQLSDEYKKGKYKFAKEFLKQTEEAVEFIEMDEDYWKDKDDVPYSIILENSWIAVRNVFAYDINEHFKFFNDF